MAGSWSTEELEQLLMSATPIVQKFLRGLSAKGTATAEQIGVHHMAPVIGLRYTRSRGKEPLYSSAKDAAGYSVFTISPKYRADISKFMAAHRVIPKPAAPPKRPVGRPRKADGNGTAQSSSSGAGRPAGAGSQRSKRAPGRRSTTDGDRFELPSDALRDWPLWAEFVAFANAVSRRGGGLVLETDGASVHVRADR